MGWVVVILWLSVDSDPPSPGAEGSTLSSLVPYVGHVAMYAVLAALLLAWRWSTHGMARPMLPAALAIFLVATVYGGGLELYQVSLAERTGSWSDALLNAGGAAGALVGMAGLRVLRRRTPR